MVGQTVTADRVVAGDSVGKLSPFKPRSRRIRLIAILAPIAAIALLEMARTSVLGNLPPESASFSMARPSWSSSSSRSGCPGSSAIPSGGSRRQNEELLALHSAGLDVAAELSLDVVLKKVVDRARALVGAQYGALSVIDDRGQIQTFITSGISDEERAAIGPPPVGHGVLGVVLHEGERLRLPDIAQHPKSAGFPANHPHDAVAAGRAGPVQEAVPRQSLSRREERRRRHVQRGRRGDARALRRPGRDRHRQRAAARKAADLAVAQERLRIAHEMHDGLAQVLGYVNTKVQAANAYLGRGKIEEATQQLHELAVAAREAYADVRESIVGLRALPVTGARWATRSRVRRSLEGAERRHRGGDDRSDAPQLRAAVELQLIRIVQESLTNVRKHAKASRVTVDIKRDGETLRALRPGRRRRLQPGRPAARRVPALRPLHHARARREHRRRVDDRQRRRDQGTTVNFEMPLRRAHIAGELAVRLSSGLAHAILIADDHALFRDGLRSLLRAEGHEIVGEAKNGREAIELAHSTKPEVVLMDLSMPEIDGLAATRLIVAEQPDVKVVILTASDEDTNLFEAIKRRRAGIPAEEPRGRRVLRPARSRQPRRAGAHPGLREKAPAGVRAPARRRAPHSRERARRAHRREREVLELMVQGVTSNRKLAKQLGVSENTVKFHVRNILDKLRLHNRAQVVGYALRKGIVDGGTQ